MQTNFAKSLKLVLQSEGGNDDDPLDRGGRTSRGIIQREYDKWRTANGQPLADVWYATDAEISTIYHDDYWEPFCDKFATGIDYLYFDLAVNGGPHRSAVTLQRSLGVVADGIIGPKTLAALTVVDPATFIVSYSDAKRAFYRSLNQPRFINGWLNRCDMVQTAAMQMIKQETT